MLNKRMHVYGPAFGVGGQISNHSPSHIYMLDKRIHVYVPFKASEVINEPHITEFAARTRSLAIDVFTFVSVLSIIV